jgi:hypothetical protein
VPPAVLGAALHDLEASTNDLEDIGGRPPARRRRQRHRDHVGGPQFARQDGRNLDAHRAVHQQTLAGADRLEETRIRAACANRKDDVAGVAE